MTYAIEFEAAALRDLKKLPKNAQVKLIALAESLSENPRPQNVEHLSGYDNLYRVRTGDFRLVYSIEDDKLVVVVVAAGDRKEIYKLLRQRFS